jgi:hypothetical protein
MPEWACCAAQWKVIMIDPTSVASVRASAPQSPTSRALPLIRACGLLPDDPILSVGDMDGELLVTLRQLGHADITVLHPSLAALQRLRERLGDLERDMLLIETEVLDFQPRRRYALWHDCGFFQRLRHAEERHRYVQLVQFALRQEGDLIICAAGLEGAHHHHGASVERHSAGALAAELGGQFELMDQAGIEQTQGCGHSRQLLHCRFKRHAPVWVG